MSSTKTINVNGVNVSIEQYNLIMAKMALSLYSKGIRINRFFKISAYKKHFGLKGKNGEEVYKNFINKYGHLLNP